MNFSKAWAIVLGLGAIGFTAPAFASPAVSTTIRDGAVPIPACLNEAKKAASKLKMENVKVDEDSVIADYKDYSVLILCYALSSAEGKTA